MSSSKLIILIFCLIQPGEQAACVSGPKHLPGYPESAIAAMIENGGSTSLSEDRQGDESMALAVPTDPNLVKFILYSDPAKLEKSEIITLNDKASLDGSQYKKNMPLKVVSHGFTGDNSSDSSQKMKNALLTYKLKNNKNYNVILVDWGRLSGFDYYFPLHRYKEVVRNVAPVGKQVAKFLMFLFKEKALKSYDDVHLIGFSLGAHVSGVAAAQIHSLEKTKVGRISGLDPAGPEYGSDQPNVHLKLDKNDAQFVEVIHTSVSNLGTTESSGHVDIYPNGGGPWHKLCRIDQFVCPHKLSWRMYVHELKNPNIYNACKCEPWNWNQNSECKTKCNDGVPIGESIPKTAAGAYYLEVDRTNIDY